MSKSKSDLSDVDVFIEAQEPAEKLRLNTLLKKRPHAIVFTEPSRTVNSQAYEADINNMVAGLTPFTQSKRGSYYINETDLPQNYEDHFNAVLAAQDTFMQLPPDVRERFGNDPAALAAALADPSRRRELEDLGVIAGPDVPPAEPAPTGQIDPADAGSKE